MKTPNLIVRIPEPCHEDWNSMQPDVKGKFCNSCSKAVFDFSNKTDQEIKQILIENKDQKVCGHFKKSQVGRPLNLKVNLNDLPRNISFSKAFIIAVFLVFGSFLFSCTDEQGHTLGDIGFEIPKTEEPPEEKYMVGMMISQIHDSLQKPIYDTPVIEENYSESMTTGGVAYVEEYVGLIVEEKEREEDPMDTVDLDEIHIVEYVDPLIDRNVMTGAISIIEESNCFGHSIINDSVKSNEEDSDDLKLIIDSKEIHIYPNPSNGEFTIKYDVLKRADVNIEILDLKGVLVRSIVNITNQYEGQYQIPVNLNELLNGIYLVNLIDNGKKTTERLVIER